MTRPALVTLCCALAAATFSGCGGNSADDPAQLRSAERVRIDRSLSDIRGYCRQVGLYFSRRGAAPTAADARRAQDAAGSLEEVAAAKPRAEYAPGQDLRALVGDTAEELEATNCSQALVRRLQEALARIPAR